MFIILRLLFKNTYKYTTPTPLVYLSDVFSIVFTLIIYNLTSKALTPSLSAHYNWHSQDYFTFIVIGELILSAPILFFESLPRSLKMHIFDGSFTHLILSKSGPAKVLIISTLSFLPRELLSTFLLFMIAKISFNLNVSPSDFVAIIMLQLAFLPSLLALSFIMSSLILLMGRGYGSASQLGLGMTLLAGQYFPIDVLPETIKKISELLLPTTALMQIGRELISGSYVINFMHIGTILLWALFLLPLSIYVFNQTLEYKLKKGSHFTFYI